MSEPLLDDELAEILRSAPRVAQPPSPTDPSPIAIGGLESSPLAGPGGASGSILSRPVPPRPQVTSPLAGVPEHASEFLANPPATPEVVAARNAARVAASTGDPELDKILGTANADPWTAQAMAQREEMKSTFGHKMGLIGQNLWNAAVDFKPQMEALYARQMQETFSSETDVLRMINPEWDSFIDMFSPAYADSLRKYTRELEQESFEELRLRQEEAAKDIHSTADEILASAAYNLPLGLATAGAGFAFGSLAALSGLGMYSAATSETRALMQGHTSRAAKLYGAASGLIEPLTEALPVNALLKRGPFKKKLVEFFAKDVGGEVAAEVLDNIARRSILDEKYDGAQLWHDIGIAVGATVVGAPVQVGTVYGVQRGAEFAKQLKVVNAEMQKQLVRRGLEGRYSALRAEFDELTSRVKFGPDSPVNPNRKLLYHFSPFENISIFDPQYIDVASYDRKNGDAAGFYLTSNPIQGSEYIGGKKGRKASPIPGGGRGYLVEIDMAGPWLDWKAPLSAQSPEVQAALKTLNIPLDPDLTGKQIYRTLQEKLFNNEEGSSWKLSQKLAEAGILGTRDVRLNRAGFAGARGKPLLSLTTRPVIGLHSALMNAIKALPFDRAPADQILNKLSKSRGVRAEEIEFSGLKEWLEAAGEFGPVSRNDLNMFIQMGGINLQENILDDTTEQDYRISPVETYHAEPYSGAPSFDYQRILYDDGMQVASRRGGDWYITKNSHGDSVLVQATDLPHLWSMRDQGVVLDPDPKKAEDEITRLFSGPWHYDPRRVTRNTMFQLPDAQNSREISLTIPSRGVGRDHVNDLTHYGRNVVVWFRVNDRDGPNGERVLFLEEMQSNWHQNGRLFGYLKPEQIQEWNRILNERQKIADEMQAVGYSDGLVHEVVWGDRRFRNHRLNNDTNWRSEWRDKLGLLQMEELNLFPNRENKKEGWYPVPEGPFKDTWTELAMKKVLDMAVREGYDAIAWTPGSIQNRRWNQPGSTRDFSPYYDKIMRERMSAALKKTDRNAKTGQEVLDFNDYTGDIGPGDPEYVGRLLVPYVRLTERTKAFIRSNGQWLMSRSGRPGNMSVREVTNAINPMLNRISERTGIQVEVIRKNEIPKEVVLDIGTSMAGYIDGNVITLISDNLADEKHTRLTLAHELFGHAGPAAILGPEQWNDLIEKYTKLSGPEVEAMRADIRERYGELDPETATKEAIAYMVEQRLGAPAIRRFLGAIRRAYHAAARAFGFGKDFGLKDIDSLITQSMRWARTGVPPARPGAQSAPPLASQPTGVPGIPGGAPGPMQNEVYAVFDPKHASILDIKGQQIEMDALTSKMKNLKENEQSLLATPPALSIKQKFDAIRTAFRLSGEEMNELAQDVIAFDWRHRHTAGLREIMRDPKNGKVAPLQQYGKVTEAQDSEWGRWISMANRLAVDWDRHVTNPHVEDAFNELYEIVHNKSIEAGRRIDSSEEIKAIAAATKMPGGRVAYDSVLGEAHFDIMSNAFRDYNLAFEATREALHEEVDWHTTNPEVRVRLKAEIDAILDELVGKSHMPKYRFGRYALIVRKDGEKVYEGRYYKNKPAAGRAVYDKQHFASLDIPRLKKKYNTNDVQIKKITNKKKNSRRRAVFQGIPDSFIARLDEALELTPEQSTALEIEAGQQSAAVRFARSVARDDPTPGYSTDFLRAYTTFFSSFANRIASLQYDRHLKTQVDAMKTWRGTTLDPTAQLKRDAMAEWMDEHRNYVKDPGREFADLRALGFAFYIAFVPKAAAMNLSQIPLVTYPMMSKDYGAVDAAVALRDAMAKYWDPTGNNTYTIGELMAIQEGLRTVLEENQATMMGAISGENNLTRLTKGVIRGSRRWNRWGRQVMAAGAYMFQEAENANREITLTATYNLGMRSHGNHSRAVLEAIEMVQRSHGEYSRYNRPQIMRGVGSPIFLFQHYVAQMAWRFGQDPARWRLFAAFMLAGGALGLPFMENAADIYNLLATFFKKKAGLQEPKTDVREDFELFMEGIMEDPSFPMKEHFDNWGIAPEDASNMLLYGLSHSVPSPLNLVTGEDSRIDLHPSVSLGRIFPGTEVVQSEKDLAQMATEGAKQGTGALGGMAWNFISAMYYTLTGESYDMWKTWEKSFPTFLRNISRSLRWGIRGQETDNAGVVIAEFDKFSDYTIDKHEGMTEIVNQLMGGPPTDLNTKTRLTYRAHEKINFYEGWRRNLMESAFKAKDDGDAEAFQAVQDAIYQYNQIVPFPEQKIPQDSIQQSIEDRDKTKRYLERGMMKEKRHTRTYSETLGRFGEPLDYTSGR